MGWGGAPAGTPACLGTGTEGGGGGREGGRGEVRTQHIIIQTGKLNMLTGSIQID